jgi:hypothetical protein
MQPEGVVFDAVAQPRGDGDMRELARLADSLVEQLDETRHHYEQLRTDLDRFDPRPTSPREREERVESPEENRERIRLFALNLALSGSTREDVSAELRDKFGVEDAGDILDAVFPESSSTREHKRRFGRRRRGS